MGRPNLEEGFKFWRDEVAELERPEKDIPYIPVIALAGIYVALNRDPQKLTSYDWRRTVLTNDDAMAGFRQSLIDFFRDRVDDDFMISIDHNDPGHNTSMQSRNKYDSVIDGLPDSVIALPENETFLAESLGLARHDDAIELNPLRLSVQGMYAFASHYPRTAEFVGEQV
ncbi:MAG: hypothetical protein JWN82_679 [Candidatus Saccharibacteria bacterium]|nr:hypothetical protein [Candidatus Saccharibacteria bacterium]